MKIASKQTRNTPKASALKSLLTLTLAAMGVFGAFPASAAPILGADLASFAVLGATSVTNDYPTNTSTIFGNVGVSAGSSITGFTLPVPGVPTVDATLQVTGGLLHATTTFGGAGFPNAADAQFQLDAAIGTLNGMANTGGTLAADLTGLTLAPGVYEVLAGTTNLSGLLTLDGSGPGANVWVFRFATTLITDEGSDVSVINVGGGSDAGIYWVVGSAATLNADTFAGNVLAQTKISSNGALTLACGRLLSATADVTLIGDTISIGCGAVGDTGFGSGGFDQAGGGGGTVPEPGSLALLGLGLAALGLARRRHG